MTIETYLAFLLASVVVVLIPGPTVMLVVSQALSSGKRSVMPLVAGVCLGDLIAMTLSFIGLGTVLASSAFLFSLLKWIGALYLMYLGIKTFRAPVFIDDASDTTGAISNQSARSQFLGAFVTTALNPKSIIFFVAFVPQFISAHAPLVPQFIILGASYLVLGSLNATAYALFAGKLRTLLRKPKAIQRFNRIGGSVLVGAGLLTAAARQR